MLRITQTSLKHKRIFERYKELIASEPNSALLPKKHFYDLLADEFFCSNSHIAKVIQKEIRRKTKRVQP